MRILHVLTEIPKAGNGIVNVAMDLACTQARDGHVVAVASSGGSEYEALLAQYGVTHYRLDQRRRPMTILRAFFGLRRIVRECRPDIVHAHMMTCAVLAAAARRGFSYRLVSTVHNEFRRDAVLMGVADRVIAVSDAVARSMEKRGIPGRKLRVVQNGTLGSPRVDRSAAAPVHLAGTAIVTVAGMFHRKGIDVLIRAFDAVATAHPDAQLYLVGDGPDRAEFEALAGETASADRIHFLGFQPDAGRYLAAAAIFVLASRKDPSPLVVPEAREAGCAIVASDVDGIPEALDRGKAGLLFPPGDPDALAKALARLLDDPALLAAYRERARANLDRLTVRRVVYETEAIYREIATAGR